MVPLVPGTREVRRLATTCEPEREGTDGCYFYAATKELRSQVGEGGACAIFVSNL